MSTDKRLADAIRNRLGLTTYFVSDKDLLEKTKGTLTYALAELGLRRDDFRQDTLDALSSLRWRNFSESQRGFIGGVLFSMVLSWAYSILLYLLT